MEQPLVVEYCRHCTMPFEYCEYGGPHPESSTAAADTAKEPVKNTKPGKNQPKAPAKPCVQLKRQERQKRKFTTSVLGMHLFSVDLKKAAKSMASKFACGAACVSKEEIVIQGDVQDQLVRWIPEQWPEITADSIQIVEVAKKKQKQPPPNAAAVADDSE